MENTLENKQKFFALYWGQKVFINAMLSAQPADNVYIEHLADVNEDSSAHDECLQLKSLSAISDEDAIEVAKLTYAMPHPNGTDFTVYLNQFGKKVVSWGDSFSQKYLAEIDTKTDIYNSLQADYLRSKGYLLPFMDLSTEQILEYKWAVIK